MRDAPLYSHFRTTMKVHEKGSATRNKQREAWGIPHRGEEEKKNSADHE